MQRKRTMKIIIRLSLTLAFFCFSAHPGYSAELTQRDWMITLVDTVGWSYGLPDEPQDPDYINILMGNRTFRFEAEDVYAPDEDNVSLMSFRNFGAYGGRGWLHAGREPTSVHLRFALPISGEYLIQAHLRQAGHKFSIDGSVQTVDGEPEFALTTVGSFEMQAGDHEVIVILPAGGSIDYITLKAPNLAAITPAAGWQPDETLTWAEIQTTLLQILDLAGLFPSNPTALTLEAEELSRAEAQVVGIPHLGHASGGKWLRAGPLSTKVLFPINLPESGFYDLSLRVMGGPIDISIGGHQEISLEAKPYLDDYTINSLFLFAGVSNLALTLPPGGGVDKLTLSARQIDTALVDTLLGLERQAHPDERALDTLTALLAAFGVKR